MQVTLTCPLTLKTVTRDIADINAAVIARQIDDDLIEVLGSQKDAEWIAHFVALVGPVEAGRVILGDEFVSKGGRKIARDIQRAIVDQKGFQGANTVVAHRVRADGVLVCSVTFHGSLIAQCGRSGWGFCFCGYTTSTTRDRINAVRGAAGLPLVGFVKGVPTVEGKAVPSNDWF